MVLDKKMYEVEGVNIWKLVTTRDDFIHRPYNKCRH